MEFNRNHYLMIGTIILLLGIQLRMVDSYVLSDSTTRFLAARVGTAAQPPAFPFLANSGPVPRKVIRPPTWLGWAAISVGSVLVLHSLAMKRPD